jgi:hypothetical protein
MPLPESLPATVDDLLSELDKQVRPAIVTGPESRECMDQLIYDSGRRSLVDQLLELRKRPR